MNTNIKKRGVGKWIAIICFVLIAAITAGFFLIPVQVLPNKYDKMICSYIMVDGKYYKSENGSLTQEQVSQIEVLLKGYKMKHTTEAFPGDDTYSPKLYLSLVFMNNEDIIISSRGIGIDSDMSAKTRVRPFIDSFCEIEDGESLYHAIMEILKLNN